MKNREFLDKVYDKKVRLQIEYDNICESLRNPDPEPGMSDKATNEAKEWHTAYLDERSRGRIRNRENVLHQIEMLDSLIDAYLKSE